MSEEGPTLDSFLRHLQTEVEAAREISDRIERDERLLQLESSIQEAIIFANRYKELQNQGVDPLLLVDPKVQQERPAPPHERSIHSSRFFDLRLMWETSRERSRLLPCLWSNEVITLLLLHVPNVQLYRQSLDHHCQLGRGILEEPHRSRRLFFLLDRWCAHQQRLEPYRLR